MNKICGECKKEKSLSEFCKNRTKSDGLQSSCKKCRNKYGSNYYLNNKQYFVDKAKNFRLQRREWYRDFKSKLKCSRCPESHSACLQFHHIDETTKLFEIASEYMNVSIEELMIEIAKCEVLCANCHLKHHYIE